MKILMKRIDNIEVTADSMAHSGSNYYYIRHIFHALREHKELLDAPEYKRLYDESLDFLFRCSVERCGWDINRREWGYGWLEFIADLDNSNDRIEKFSKDIIDCFLTERRKAWNS